MIPERTLDGYYVLNIVRCLNCGKVTYPFESAKLDGIPRPQDGKEQE